MKIITILIERHHKAGDLGRYSFRYTLPNGATCSDDWFSTVTDAERAAVGSLAYSKAGKAMTWQFEYSPGCFNA